MRSRPCFLNTGAASAGVIGFFDRTLMRSPDHVALLMSRSLNVVWKSASAAVSVSGLSAENRVVRMGRSADEVCHGQSDRDQHARKDA